MTHLGVDVAGVAWRPDSQALAFTANTHQRDDSLYERNDLWTIDLGRPHSAANRRWPQDWTEPLLIHSTYRMELAWS